MAILETFLVEVHSQARFPEQHPLAAAEHISPLGVSKRFCVALRGGDSLIAREQPFNACLKSARLAANATRYCTILCTSSLPLGGWLVNTTGCTKGCKSSVWFRMSPRITMAALQRSLERTSSFRTFFKRLDQRL